MSEELSNDPFDAGHVIELLDGTKRFVGLNPVEDNHLQMRAGLRSFSEYLDANQIKRPPRSEWKPVNNQTVFTSDWFLNQMQTSGCVGGSSAGAFMRARWFATGVFEVLSGASIYARINGNRDRGAVIVDAVTTGLMQFGACLHSEFDYPNIFVSQMSAAAVASAKTRLVAEALTADSFDDICLAIQLGKMPVYPVGVDRNWERYDADGAVNAVQGISNHSVTADGLIWSGSEWMLDGVNDWSKTWGLKKNGRFIAKERSVQYAATKNDAYIIVVAAVDSGAQEAG